MPSWAAESELLLSVKMSDDMLPEAVRSRASDLARRLCNNEYGLPIATVIRNFEKFCAVRVNIIATPTIRKYLARDAVAMIKRDSVDILVSSLPSAPGTGKDILRILARELYICYVGIQKQAKRTPTTRDNEAAGDYFSKLLVDHFEVIESFVDHRTGDYYGDKEMLAAIGRLRHKSVLILGQYSEEGGRRIRRIEAGLGSKGFRARIFGDLAGAEDVVRAGRIREEVLTVAKLSKFVIVEDSEASGHLLELADLGMASVTTAIMRQEGMGSTILTTSLLKKYKVFMREFIYEINALSSALDAVIAWAEEVEIT